MSSSPCTPPGWAAVGPGWEDVPQPAMAAAADLLDLATGMPEILEITAENLADRPAVRVGVSSLTLRLQDRLNELQVQHRSVILYAQRLRGEPPISHPDPGWRRLLKDEA